PDGQSLGNLLWSALTASSTPRSPSASPMVLPVSYAGESAGCGGFLLQVSLYIEAQTQKFSTDLSKVAFLISLLSGAINNSFEAFTSHFKEVFCSSVEEISTAEQLLRLRQGETTTSD
uniref:DUF4939 domain-containing protein n=1 Tax=Cyprinus carpio carpio TaxID=630221 RepID=A0A9J7Y7T6_CYPCA